MNKKIVNIRKSQLEINESVEGDTMEIQMERILNNGEMESLEQKELKYTNPEDGIIAITDIRSDKFDMAIEQNEKILEDQRGRLEEKRKDREEKLKKLKEKDDNGVAGQSVDTTSNTPD